MKGTFSRFALLPLRLFLGVTFLYAGIDKFTDGVFFTSQPGGMESTLNAVRSSSAIPAMIDLALKNPDAFGYAMAGGELAVGIGLLAGLFSRLAAVGGALISLSLWLTVSWAASPYYYGNDLPYMVAFLPLVLAGAPMLSLDELIAKRGSRGRQG